MKITFTPVEDSFIKGIIEEARAVAGQMYESGSPAPAAAMERAAAALRAAFDVGSPAAVDIARALRAVLAELVDYVDADLLVDL